MPDASSFASYARLLRLVPVADATPQLPESQVPVAAPVGQRKLRRLAKKQGLISLLLLVILPTCLATSYFWLLAADRYESEARFILRTPGKNPPNAAISNLMENVGVSRTSDDGEVVREFLESRDAVRLLERTANLRQAFGGAPNDPVWGYPAFFKTDNQERLFEHYQRMMSATFDSGTGVGTLKIQAFAPKDAQRLATALLGAAEALVNRLHERAQSDAIKDAEAEVDRMRRRTLAAQGALTSFRERERLIDPSQATVALLETIARLSVDAANLSIQISELSTGSPGAPQLAALRNRRGAVESQIALERQRLAGDAQSIAPRIAEYERLMLEREFAQTALTGAMTALEMARIEAQRQRVYLERVVEPSEPDYPAYPLRIVWTLVTLAAGYMAYRIWRILEADTRRHSDL